MKAGPKPKPTHLKVLAGNPGKRPLTPDVKPRPIPPDCPAFLSAAGKREWKKVAPELDRLGLLTVVDGPALAIYCQAWADYKEAIKVIKAEGVLIKAYRGRVKNPACQVARDNALLIKSFAAEFGLTPSSRTQFKAMEVPDDDQDIYDT